MAIAAVAALSLILDTFLYYTGKRARLQQRRGAFIRPADACASTRYKCRCVYRAATVRRVGRARRGSPRPGRVYIYGRKNILS